jgi:hypothetical protein
LFTDLNNGYNVTQFYAGAFGPGDDDLLIGGTQDNGTHGTRHDDLTFNKIFGGDGAYCGISQQSDVIYYSTQNGYIRRSDTSFKGSVNIYSSLRAQTGSNDYWFINPFEVNPEDGDQVYFPTRRKLYITVDRGNSWYLVSSNTPSYAYAVGIGPGIEPTVYLGGASGLLWRIDTVTSAKPGTHYDLRTFAPGAVRSGFIGNVEVDPNNPGTIYLALNNYGSGHKIWRVDSADQDTPVFTSISGNMPNNLPVNWLEVDNKNSKQIMAATDFGLYVTDNGGESWEKIEDIPNVQIPMIELKESTGKLYVYTHGRGIWMVKLKREPVISVEDVQVNREDLRVFPNPSSDFISIGDLDPDRMFVMGLDGSIKQVPRNGNGLDIRQLPAGVYILSVESRGRTMSQRFVKY